MMLIFFIFCLYTIPVIHVILPYIISVAGFDIYMFDLLTACAFMYWVGPFIFAKNIPKGFIATINRTYLYFLLVGIVPICIGLYMGKGNLLYAYRFFFYFVWVPVLVRLLQNRLRAVMILKILVFLNGISVIMELIAHLATKGLRLGYLDIHSELNLVITLVLLALILTKQHLFSSRVSDYIAFLICILGVVIDPSRKIYLGVLVGAFIIVFSQRHLLKKDKKFKKTAITIFLIITLLVSLLGVTNLITARFSTIFISPSQIQSMEGVDYSGMFRLYALLNGLDIVRQNPYFGVGAGDAIEMQSVMHSRFGYNSSLSPHNFYLSALLYYGIPMVLWIYFIVIRFVKLSYHETVSRSEGLLSKYGTITLGIIAGFVGFMVAMFFEGYEVESVVDTWLFMGLLLGFFNLNSRLVIAGKKHLGKQQAGTP